MPGKELAKTEKKEISNQPLPGRETLADMLKKAETYIKSGYLPDAIKKPEQVVIIMETARALDLEPVQAFGLVHVIKGKPTLSAEVMRGLVYRTYKDAKIDYPEGNNDKICRVEVQRPGGKVQKFEYTWEQAKRAGLVNKDNWQKYPEDMLRARATARAIRAVFPDVILGISYTPEELGAVVDAKGDMVKLPDDEEIAQAFVEFNVTREMLDRYCLDHFKHDLSQIDEKEVGELRTVFNAIKVKKEPVQKYFAPSDTPSKPLPPPEQIKIDDVEKPKDEPETKPDTKEKTDEEIMLDAVYKERYQALLKLTQRHRKEFKNPVYSTVVDKALAEGPDPMKKSKVLEKHLTAIGVDVEQALADLANEKG